MANKIKELRHDECIALLNKINKPATPGVTIITQLTAPKPISDNNPPTPLNAVFALLADMDADCPYTGFDHKRGIWLVDDVSNIAVYEKQYYVAWINCVVPLEFFMALLWQAGWQVSVLTWEVLECAGDIKKMFDENNGFDNKDTAPAPAPPKQLAVDDYEACTDDELEALADVGDDFAREELVLRKKQRAALAKPNNLIVMPQEQVRQALILHAVNKSKLN